MTHPYKVSETSEIKKKSQISFPGTRKNHVPSTNMNRTHTQTKHTSYLNSCTYCTTLHMCTSVNTNRNNQTHKKTQTL